MSSLRGNITASYAGQLYVTIIGIAMVPMYVRYMGAEAYGLVGFFAMLQAWFSLLDIGLTPTIAREASRYRGGAADAASFWLLARTLEYLFLVVAVAGGALLFVSSDYIARDWLRVAQLTPDEVGTALRLMALIVAMRWMCGIYRGMISGAERLVWLSAFNSLVATLRFAGVLPLLAFVGATSTIFFRFQLGVALVELACLFLYAHRLLPRVPADMRMPRTLVSLKPVLKFSLTIAVTSSVWVLLTQLDKLVLSRILPLTDYGHFTLATLAASGVMVISGPVGAAVMPRLSILEAEGDRAGFIRVYRQTTQLVSVVCGTAALTAAFFAEPLLWAWTGDKSLAHDAAPILALYALGNGVLCVSAFPYYMQYAKGDLKLHLVANALFVVLLIPLIIWAATRHGAVGAGCVWVFMNAISFLIWPTMVHRRFKFPITLRWYVQDVLLILFVAAVVGYGSMNIVPTVASRWLQFAGIALAGTVVIAASALASSELRTGLIARLARLSPPVEG